VRYGEIRISGLLHEKMTETEEIKEIRRACVDAVLERNVADIAYLSVTKDRLADPAGCYDVAKLVEGNGEFRTADRHIAGRFHGKPGSYQLRLKLPNPLARANGLTVRYRIHGWSKIRYLAIGHSKLVGFRHVKVNNPKQEEWVTFSIGYGDIAYRLQNEWKTPEPCSIADVRLYISGTPSEEGGAIDCAWVGVWLEEHGKTTTGLSYNVNPALFDSLKRYFSRCNPKIDEQAQKFLESGVCPMTGDTVLPWEIDEPLPTKLPESGTYRYIWHAMQPAVSMLVYGDNHHSQAAIHAARDYISDWLERSFFNVDPDTKYSWYDHGTAERLMALVLMHEVGLQQGFDYRFMSRLRLAILRHSQLLESEVFYAYHQPTRYHNHAWFQDMALIAVAVAMPNWPCAARWVDRALERLEDQLATLIVRDGGYAIFVENSIGYHHGIQRLVEFAGELANLSGRKTEIPKIAEELTAWSEFLRYPDGRTPSQGDTFRRPNPTTAQCAIRRGRPYDQPSTTVLPDAGYAVVNGNHEGKPYMLCMFATSLCKTHKHEDNLSITLWFDGIEWLIDPSFYSHDYDDLIPQYLRSAEAHNSLWIPEIPYSIEPGNATLRGALNGHVFTLMGAHSAYEGFCVSRRLSGSVRSLHLECLDTITGDLVTRHGYPKLVFHLGEGVNVSSTNDGFCLCHDLSNSRINVNVFGNDWNVINGYTQNGVSVAGTEFRAISQTRSILVRSSDTGVSWTLEAC